MLLAGFLGGYPVGAQNIANAYRNGQLSRRQAEIMLGFCSNAGPAFLFGMIGPLFPRPWYAWGLWAIHVSGALLAGLLLPRTSSGVQQISGKPMTLTDALYQAIRVTAAVCGWIVLFRIVIAFLSRWILWALPPVWNVLVMGLLELSNGCLALSAVEDVAVRFLLCSIFLGFGGLCVTMQTLSVSQGLSLGYYFPGKCIQTAWSALIAWLIFSENRVFPAVGCFAVLVLAIWGVFLRKKQNYSGNPQPIGV